MFLFRLLYPIDARYMLLKRIHIYVHYMSKLSSPTIGNLDIDLYCIQWFSSIRDFVIIDDIVAIISNC